MRVRAVGGDTGGDVRSDLNASNRDIIPSRVARFRQIDTESPHVHHDALEFPDGRVVLVTRLVEGQHATVLQLPAESGETEKPVKVETPTEAVDFAR
jgi:hypothetical protein